MSDSTTSSDFLVRGLGLGGRARIVAATTTRTVEELRHIHDSSPTTATAIGRLATGALLLAASLEKVTGREPMVSLELDGGGPAGRIIATASPRGWVRAFASNPTASAPSRPDGKLDVAAVVGTSGHLVVTRDPGIGQPYRGVVPLVAGEIAQDVASYLLESEQTPSAVVLGVFVVPQGRIEHAGGFLVQLLPGVSEEEAADLTQRVRELGPVTARLAEGEGPMHWIEHLVPEGFELLEQLPVEFRCGCSLDRVERALKLLGAAEIEGLLETAPAELTCEFCRRRYEVSRDELESLLVELELERSPAAREA